MFFMLKRIYSYAAIILGSVSFLVACSDDDDNNIKHYSAQADVSNSYQYTVFNSETMASEKYKIVMLFSTDNGATYVEYPQLKVGQSYKIKMVDRTDDGDIEVTSDDSCLKFDWSASTPGPISGTNDAIAEFKMASSNDIVVKIADYTPYQASSWTGKWIGVEVGGSNDKNTITQDPTNPNKFIMNNFFGDGVDAYFTMNPSTNAVDQLVTLPEQTTSEGGVASGTGSYDQCRGTFTIATTYKIDWGDGDGMHTYKWQYIFHR
jgi:hypothetical protein